jgi:hypothetical protein
VVKAVIYETPRKAVRNHDRRLHSQCLQFPLLVDALQAPLQEINLQRLPGNLALELCGLASLPAPPP